MGKPGAASAEGPPPDLTTGRLTIVNYHYCLAEHGRFTSGMRGVTPAQLERQVTALQASRTEVTAKEAVEAVSGTGPTRDGFLITADDGAHGFFAHALPILKRHGLGAILFCCTQPLRGKVLDVQKVHLLSGRMGTSAFQSAFMAAIETHGVMPPAPDHLQRAAQAMYRYDSAETAAFKRQLNVLLPRDVVSLILSALFEEHLGPEAEAAKQIYMSRDDILAARDMGFTIGAHTHNHLMLSSLTPVEQAADLEQCRDDLADVLGEPPRLFSYPFGIDGTYTAVTRKILKSLGFDAAFTLGRRVIDRPVSSAFEIPRFDVNDIFDDSGELQETMA